MLRRLLPVLQVLITAGLLAWIFRDASRRSEMAHLWSLLDLRWALWGLAAAGLNELGGAARWWCCLHLAGLGVRFPRAAALHFMGLFSTLFLPGAAGGDAVKMAWLAAEFPERKIGGVLAALMDRLTGLVTVTAVATFIALRRRAWFQQTPATAALFHAVMIFFAAASVGLLLWGLTSLPRWLGRHPQWLPGRSYILEISSIFARYFARPRLAAVALGLSLVSFASFALIYYCAARALALPVSFTDVYSVMPVIDVVTMLPVTLSGIGLREKAFETMLVNLCGIPAGGAVLISLTGFGLYACWSLLGGPVFVFYRTRRRTAEPHV